MTGRPRTSRPTPAAQTTAFLFTPHEAQALLGAARPSPPTSGIATCADPLSCSGETFTSFGTIASWLTLS